MAVLFDPNKPQDQNNQNQGQAQQIVGAQAPSSGSDQSTSQTNPNQGTSSGRFSNITNYIKANQNFNQGNGLAGKITSNIQNQGDQVTKNVANAVNQFNQQSQGVVSQAQQGAQAGQNFVAKLLPSNLTYQASLINTGLKTENNNSPINYTINQDQVSQDKNTPDNSTFSAIRNTLDNNYSGPSSLADLSGQQNQSYLQNQAKNLDTQTGQAQTESGRYNLLRTMFNKPSYNTGQQNLDNLLIQGNGSQLQNLQDTRKISNQAGQSLNNAITQTGQAGTKAAQDYAASQNQLINTLNGGVSNINTDLTDRASKAKDKQTTDIQKLITDYNSGKLTSDEYARIGAGNSGIANGQYNYGVNLDPTYLSPTQTPTAQNIANSDDLAKINALSNLINGGSKSVANQDVSQLLAQYKDATPNSYNNNFNFNTGAYQQAINAARTNYDTQNTNADRNYANVLNDVNAKIAQFQQYHDNSPLNQDVITALNNLRNYEQTVTANYQAQKAALQKLLGNKINIDPASVASDSDGSASQ